MISVAEVIAYIMIVFEVYTAARSWNGARFYHNLIHTWVFPFLIVQIKVK
jgi:hypothetical protein